jgi:hypothetical protein
MSGSKLETANEVSAFVMGWTLFLIMIYWMFKPGPDGGPW